MSLEVRGVDHQTIGFTAHVGELGKNPVEHAQTAPADKAVVDRLVGTIGGTRICASLNIQTSGNSNASTASPLNEPIASKASDLMGPEPKMTSSIAVASHRTTSSISYSASCPSECDSGHMGRDRCTLV